MENISRPHSNLNRFLARQVVEGQQPDESSCHIIFRVSAVTSSISLIAIGQTAFFNVSRALATNHEVIGWVLAGSNCIAFGVVDAWAMAHMGNELVRPISEAERMILSTNASRMKDLILRVASFGTACFSIVPHIYMGYYYNDNSVGFAALAAVTDVWLPAASLHMTFESLQKYFLNESEKHLLQSKNALLELIQNNCDMLLTESDESIREFINAFAQLGQLDSSLDKAQGVIKLITERPVEPPETPGRVRTYARKLAQSGGVVLSCTAIFMNAVIGYRFADYFTDSVVVNTLSGGIVAGSSAYLLTGLIMASTTSFYDVGVNLLQGKLPQSWGSRYRPKLTFMLKLSALLISSLSFAPSVELSNENFDGYMEDYMKVATPMAFVLAAGFLLLNLIDEFMEKYLAVLGEGDVKELMIINQRIKHLTRVLQNSSLIEYAKFCNFVPEDILARWGQRAEAIHEALESNLFDTEELSSLI